MYPFPLKLFLYRLLVQKINRIVNTYAYRKNGEKSGQRISGVSDSHHAFSKYTFSKKYIRDEDEYKM